jgi:cysteinyl-tRNA synthetase
MNLATRGDRLHLYNTLTNKKERFETLDPKRVTMYTCGPTVYRDVHIGNLRSYLMADWLKRVLMHLGYLVFHLKNITDVGHMRQELLERGEDKVIAAARAAGKTSQAIAQQYTERFLGDEGMINILPADLFPRATEHIPQCIALIQKMLKNGHAYLAGGNVYFDVTTFPDYGKLSGNLPESLLRGVRVEIDPLKRNPEDFALWKAAESGREMKWHSPWGEGFPGWHIECSAMSMHYLGAVFDVHTGGVDNIFPHHEDEIAQSESVVGKQVVRYWVHGQHLLADGLKMAKSTGNDYTIRDIENRGFDPLAFRYLCLTVHYRSRLNFTFNALKAAQRGLSHLRRHVEDSASLRGPRPGGKRPDSWRGLFSEAICDDLALPRALSNVWRMLRDKALTKEAKAKLLVEFDQVLGLDLETWPQRASQVPEEVRKEAARRDRARMRGDYTESDQIRDHLASKGFEFRDLSAGSRVLQRSRVEWRGYPREISSSREVPTLLKEPDQYDVSVSLVAHNNWPELRRTYESVKTHGTGHRLQVIIVDGGSTDETRDGVARLAEGDHDTVVFFADHPLGEGASRNATLRQALGAIVVLLDVSVELTGDLFTPLIKVLAEDGVGATGARGVITENCQDFLDSDGPEVHAMTLYCFAFPRKIIHDAGWLNERFRFYRHLDLDYSFKIRSHGYRILASPGLPLRFHRHKIWEDMDEHERFRRSRANFYMFYRRWHHHEHLYRSASA